MYGFTKNKFIKISQSNLFPMTILLSDTSLIQEEGVSHIQEDLLSPVFLYERSEIANVDTKTNSLTISNPTSLTNGIADIRMSMTYEYQLYN